VNDHLRPKADILNTEVMSKDNLNECLEIAKNTFEEIKSSFPNLRMEIINDDPNVDLVMNIKIQDGLDFDVHLNLQNNDELHLTTDVLWVEWFPCTFPEKVAEYIEAVSGVLSGEYRILEHYKGEKAIKAQLQKPVEQGWQTIHTWGTLYWPFIKKRSFKVLQNGKGRKQVLSDR